ncbi:SulP family inorganic anion transporter [Pontibacillus sp. ALD_SL1]|uniref:SulP family inorganic anion transporter n=1 Tax=Pontibacillus sp. ALD_SL1 TaxID=2777185 RepID=UPI001A97086E|nr:SulP family inorganic anion transporter [Pontibacillus sp. ALD_SL1]QST00750.1 SulP family inorganic anion transporter [Pontibacillus sp. ALD_SL1]
MELQSFKGSWFINTKGDLLSGTVVALALVPEAIAFSIIAGVDPMVGLYASFIIAVVIAFVGGRPGMISGATGAMALLMVDLVAGYGLSYLLAATILTGILQIAFGIAKLARFMRFIPRSVMVGFVNVLAILIFTAQLEHFSGAGWVMYAMVIGTLAIIYLLPRVSTAVPSALVAIVVITAIAFLTNTTVSTVGDMGEITKAFPSFFLPAVPLTFETLRIIFPYALGLSIVGLVESLLTASIVDESTGTYSNKNQESKGQGIANIITGCFGGMAGCAMIGQSVINVKSGGRGRLSSLTAGVVHILLIVFLGDIVSQIPMAALVGVMIMVSVGTFDWNSIKTIPIVPLTDNIVMVVTVVTVILTHNLAIGVLTGILLSSMFFVHKISKVHVRRSIHGSRMMIYFKGELFFASVTDLFHEFDYTMDGAKEVVLDFSEARIWDDSAVAVLDKIVRRFEEQGINAYIIGLNKLSSDINQKLARKLDNH